MSKGTLAARVRALEAARAARGLASLGGGSLSLAEREELRQLEAAEAIEHEKIASKSMTGAEADAWLYAHSIDGSDPRGDRLDSLRRRNRSPAEVAADEAAIGAMDPASWPTF